MAFISVTRLRIRSLRFLPVFLIYATFDRHFRQYGRIEILGLTG